MQQRIVCAANQHPVTKEIVLGIRHWDMMMRTNMSATGEEDWHNSVQGFVDQYGVFLTREEAWCVAQAAGQIIRRVGGDTGKLFSENLY